MPIERVDLVAKLFKLIENFMLAIMYAKLDKREAM